MTSLRGDKMNYNTVLVVVFLILIAFIVLRILVGPIKILIKLMFSSSLGLLGISLFNLVASVFGIHIGINMLTIITVGILGIPGMVLLLILQTVIKV